MALCCSNKCWCWSSHGNTEIPALNLPTQSHLCSKGTKPYYSKRTKLSRRFTVQHTRFLKGKKNHLNSSRSPALPCTIYALTLSSLPTYKCSLSSCLSSLLLERLLTKPIQGLSLYCLIWCHWVNWIISLWMILFCLSCFADLQFTVTLLPLRHARDVLFS